MKKKLYIFIGLIMLLPSIVQGAELKFKKTAEFINIGNIFDIALIINTEDESINAIETVLKYSDNLKLENISDGNSIINLWISKPKLENSQQGFVSLSGLIPGGVRTSEGVVLSVTFRSLYNGTGDIQVEDAKVFLNDPDVPEAKLKVANLNFEIQNNQTTAPQGQKLILDFLPPDEFKIYLSKDKSLFDNFWFISFNAQDKGSGIDHYEARERFLGVFGDWRRAESPYQLKHQSLFSIIQVKAVDKVGRETRANFVPERFFIAGGILLLLAAALTGLRINTVWRKKLLSRRKS